MGHLSTLLGLDPRLVHVLGELVFRGIQCRQLLRRQFIAFFLFDLLAHPRQHLVQRTDHRFRFAPDSFVLSQPDVVAPGGWNLAFAELRPTSGTIAPRSHGRLAQHAFFFDGSRIVDQRHGTGGMEDQWALAAQRDPHGIDG